MVGHAHAVKDRAGACRNKKREGMSSLCRGTSGRSDGLLAVPQGSGGSPGMGDAETAR